MNATKINLVPTTEGARTWKTQAGAYNAGRRVAQTLGTGCNPLGCSGAGNVAVGCLGGSEYVVYVRDRGWLAK